jgi:hypothetical protein
MSEIWYFESWMFCKCSSLALDDTGKFIYGGGQAIDD